MNTKKQCVFWVLVWPCQLFVRLWYCVSDVLDLSLVSKRFGFWPHITHVIGKRQKEERTSVPRPLSWNIYVKKQCWHINRAGYNNVCELIDWLLKVQQAIFQSYSGWKKFVSKKSERGDSGMDQHKGLYGSGYYTPGDMTCCVSNFWHMQN
jgi:hypothetical protein